MINSISARLVNITSLLTVFYCLCPDNWECSTGRSPLTDRTKSSTVHLSFCDYSEFPGKVFNLRLTLNGFGKEPPV